MAVVLVVTPRFFPSSRRATPTIVDTSAARSAAAAVKAPAAPTPATVTPSAPSVSTQAPSARPIEGRETTTLTTPRAEIVLTNPGAAPAVVRIPSYLNLSPAPIPHDTSVTLSSGRNPLLSYRLARGADTIALDTLPFRVTKDASTITFASAPITLSYQATSDGFRTAVRGTVPNAPAGSALLIDLPSQLHSVEADTLDDMRHLAYGFKPPHRDVVSLPFSKLDSLKTRFDTGGMQWVVARNKYWLVAVMQPVGESEPAATFHGLTTRGGSYIGKVAGNAHAATSYPIGANGQIAFDLYAGPQALEALHALGNDLENVNPYAGFLHPVVQPFATIVTRVLLWMKATLRVNYGWVLVLFGVLVRLLLWPLNQKAMRTSIQMQRLQPELSAVQKRYKSEPDKQREALVKLYQEHGMSPLSPMLGCLPMLLPMPVLFALYFVFQNTIEFRGVPFLWLPDLALRDPFYITPIVMGISMFALSWIGMRGVPPNPQTKMMSFMMPVMFTVMFLNLASGLNLYYAVQNIASLPQQWMITRARAKAGVSTAPARSSGKAVTPGKAGGAAGGGGGVRKT
jgi:membrane protein insertase, YidC/Oxa1 family, C-terminal domain